MVLLTNILTNQRQLQYLLLSQDEVLEVLCSRGFSAEVVYSSVRALMMERQSAYGAVTNVSLQRSLNMLHDVLLPNAECTKVVSDALEHILSATTSTMLWRWVGNIEQPHMQFRKLYSARDNGGIINFINHHKGKYVWGFDDRAKPKEYIGYNNLLHNCIEDDYVAFLSIIIGSPWTNSRPEFNQPDKTGLTPAQLAGKLCKLHHLEIIASSELLDASARVNVVHTLLISVRAKWLGKAELLSPSSVNVSSTISSLLSRLRDLDLPHYRALDPFGFGMLHSAVAVRSVTVLSVVMNGYLRKVMLADDGGRSILECLEPLLLHAVKLNKYESVAYFIGIIKKFSGLLLLVDESSVLLGNAIMWAIDYECFCSLVALTETEGGIIHINNVYDGMRPLELAFLSYMRSLTHIFTHSGADLNKYKGEAECRKTDPVYCRRPYLPRSRQPRRHSIRGGDADRTNNYYLQTVRLLLSKGASPLNQMDIPVARKHTQLLLSRFVAVSSTNLGLQGMLSKMLQRCDNLFALAAALSWNEVVALLFSCLEEQQLACVSHSPSVTASASCWHVDSNTRFHFAGKSWDSNPLVYAAGFGHSECLEYLLQKSVFVNLVNHVDINGMTTLSTACLANDHSSLLVLKRFAVDPSQFLPVGVEAAAHKLPPSRKSLMMECFAKLGSDTGGAASKNLVLCHKYLGICESAYTRFKRASSSLQTRHLRSFADSAFRSKKGSQPLLLVETVYQVVVSVRTLHIQIGVDYHITLSSPRQLFYRSASSIIASLVDAIRLFGELLSYLLFNELVDSSSQQEAALLKELTAFKLASKNLHEILSRSINKWVHEASMKPALPFALFLNSFAETVKFMTSTSEGIRECSGDPSVSDNAKLKFVRSCHEFAVEIDSILRKPSTTTALNVLLLNNLQTQSTLTAELVDYLAGFKFRAFSSVSEMQYFSLPSSSTDSLKSIWWEPGVHGQPLLFRKLIPLIVRYESDLVGYLKFLCRASSLDYVCWLLW
jgi:hypothetical protein